MSVGVVYPTVAPELMENSESPAEGLSIALHELEAQNGGDGGKLLLEKVRNAFVHFVQVQLELRQSEEALKQLEDKMETDDKIWDAERPLRKKIIEVLKRRADACDELLAHNRVLRDEQAQRLDLVMMYGTEDQADTLHAGIDEKFRDGMGLTTATRARTDELLIKVESIEAELKPLQKKFQKMFGDLDPACKGSKLVGY